MGTNGVFYFEEIIDSAAKAENSVPFEFYKARDGAQLPFRRYAAESDVYTILIHGSSADSTYLYSLSDFLSSNNLCHVYTPDLRGHGPETRTRGDISYVDQLEDDIADLIQFIRAKAGADARIIVGGHSSGGSMAVRFAGGQYGNLVTGVVLLAPYLGHDSPAVRKNTGGWAQVSIPKVIAISLLNQLGITFFNRVKVLKFNKQEEYQTEHDTLEYSYNLMTGMQPADFGDSLRRIQVPVISLIGSEDEVFYPSKFEANITPYKKDARVVIVENARHLGIVTDKAVMAEISNWIRSMWVF
ncbi:alpha/beta hydrolase [Endozoicomonas sp. OPT23]|uniref:alpha/beta hydrolase n=1 Tax=Endozoicomonas sp. OPT23 TaxID=2072845 RepID=UPI0018915CBA|nr:alpha/beta hydrolase [Endozoicomonas sp. OPT23]